MLARPFPLPALSFCAALALLAAACSRSGDSGAAGSPAGPTATRTNPPITAEARKDAAEMFSLRCAPCHGPQGRGDGPASAGLTPRPRNYQDQAWQSSVTDEYIEKIILYGGAAVGKSAAMPPNPDLQGKPEVVAALRAQIRALGKQ